MTSYKSLPGMPNLTISHNKAFSTTTTGLFRINGPIAIQALYGVLDSSLPSMNFNFQLVHTSSLSGETNIGALFESYYEAYSAGSVYSVATTTTGYGNFNVAFRAAPTDIIWYTCPGEIQILSNSNTSSCTWNLVWSALHPTSSVVAL